MKAEELMRFDWVHLADDNAPRQVDWIRSGEVGLFWNKTVTPPYLEPIPLTTEILKKNGFYEVSKRRWVLSDEYTGDEVLVLYEVANAFAMFTSGLGIGFQNVHELQHLFKLFGITKEIDL